MVAYLASHPADYIVRLYIMLFGLYNPAVEQPATQESQSEQ